MILDLAKAVQISGRRERSWSSSLDVGLGEGCTNFRRRERSWSSSLDLGLGEGCTNFRQERKIMEQ